MEAATARPLGLKAIIAYKFVKAPIVLAVAVLLTFFPHRSHSWALAAVSEISEWGAMAVRVAHWLRVHLTATVQTDAAVLAWLDAISTFIEGLLLLSGKPWGEWIVVGSVSSLIPFELAALAKRPTLGRAAILGVNVAVAAYLAWRRVSAHRLARRGGARARPRRSARSLEA